MAVDTARAKSLFLAAADFADSAERAAYLNRECAGNLELLDRVEGLLRANDASPLPEPEQKGETGDYGESRAVSVNSVIVGKYKLVEEIGEGGMGHVYMAQQVEPVRRAVAVKVIKPGMDSKAVLARFEAERQALAMMDHPNIARVLDAGTTDGGRPFFVMELVKGVPITEFCDGQQLTLRDRLELFVPVCLAIQHAHQKGIIHRDIKPSNVLIALYDDRPAPKVIDFGVAKAVGQPLTDRTLMTGFGAIVGTPEYMSPEQASFNQADIDTRSDVYSLGVLLYELLTGSTPIDRNSLGKAPLLEVLRIVRDGETARPSTMLSTLEALPSVAANRGTEPAKLTSLVRGDLDWIVMKALEKERSRRYESASEFAADIRRFLANQPVLACPPSIAYRLRKFVRRNRTVVTLSAGVLLLSLAMTIGGWLYRSAKKETERERLQSDQTARINEAYETLPLIQAAIRQGDHRSAFELLQKVEPLIPDHPGVPELREQCSHTCSITTDPPEADVWFRPYDQPNAPWQHVVRTTDRKAVVRVAHGEYLWRATKAGYAPVIGLRPPQATRFTLDPEGTIPQDMVRIPGGEPERPGMESSAAFQSVRIPAFFIDRCEVTNAEYDRFVKSGGYDRADYWQDLPFVGADGKATTWQSVKPQLVDQTGRPGPATWRNGAFLPGEEDHPVRGVSWYEATAFARFAGKSLPTVFHRVQAAPIELSVVLAGDPFIIRSNFRSRVESVRTLSDYGFYGTVGTMGNVKEWCANATGEGNRYILGGSCGEPIYTPLILDNSQPIRRDEFFGFRCVKFIDDARGPALAWDVVKSNPWPTPPKREDLLDAATFRLVVQDRFAYDHAAPLDVTTEQTDEGDWLHVVSRVNAAYRDARGRWERMAVHVYLPKGINPRQGYQTVVYYPGGDASMLPRIRPLADEYGLDALVRSGRAVVHPVYQGHYERRFASDAADARAEEERRICLGQDLMRAIDYLQRRGDINMDQLAYYGFSGGASSAGSFLAVEPRFRAAVFEAGGLGIDPLRTDRALLEWLHCLPHIRIPVLMINGSADPIFPVKESQEPLFRLLGSPVKEHYIHPNGHHMLAPAVKFEQTIRWLDRQLGPVRKEKS